MEDPVMRRLVILVAVLVAVMIVAPAPPAAVAQDAGALTLSLTPSMTKAKIGDFVEFTVRVENAGTEPLTGLFVSLGLPDALDARAKSCPSRELGEDVTSCWIGDLDPGQTVEVSFTVHVGSRTRTINGTVTAQLSDGTYPPLAFVAIPAIKIVGSPKER